MKEKNEVLTISMRGNRELRDEFHEICQKMDTNKSKEIREFMRQFVIKNGHYLVER